MSEVFEREVEYVEVQDGNGRTVTHMVMKNMGRFSKKTPRTYNKNGLVITEYVNEK